MNKKYGYYFNSEIGKLSITEENSAIIKISFSEKLNDCEIKKTNLIQETIIELEEYFKKKRKYFNIKIKLNGTDFQKKVWEELSKIPYGETKSYKEIANKIGNPKAARAVGLANNKNPIPIIIPCHRVIGTNGKLTGYAGGINIKQKLLNIEKTL